MSKPTKMRMCQCAGCGVIKLCAPCGTCLECIDKYIKEVKKVE